MTTHKSEDNISDKNIHTVPDLQVLSLQDINYFIDNLTQKGKPTLQQFTTADLKEHINGHWHLKICLQMDSGASDCITPDKSLLKHFKYVKSRSINTTDITSAGCQIEGEGYMDSHTASGDWLTVKVLYVPNASGIIISPTFIAKNDPHFTSWNQMSHTDTGTAQIIFFNKHEYRPKVSPHMYEFNNCWYLDQSYLETVHRAKGRSRHLNSIDNKEHIVNSLSRPAEYELWHQRLIHPGKTCMDALHHCVDGIPSLKRHDFHTCPICQEAKITHNYNHNVDPTKATKVGQIFSMDFGFVKGKVDNRLVRSHESYSSYILIVDHKTRYTWVFLAKNKQPPIQMIKNFLTIYGLKDDEGGVIDPDYTGEIIVILHNTSKNAYTVNSGDRIAQLILEKFVSAPIQVVSNFSNTERGTNGFGSTGINSLQMKPTKALQACDLTMSLNEPCDIMDIVVDTNHSHPVLGFQLDKTLTVTTCIPGTPAAKVKGWRNTIKGSTLVAVNKHPVHNLKEISENLDKKIPTALLQFKTTLQPTYIPRPGQLKSHLINLSLLQSIIKLQEMLSRSHNPLIQHKSTHFHRMLTVSPVQS